ncbi:uncharacterized protein LOC143902777 [Temnothorax americanus]|uniref:uncharacterized protein LOC143902777 n=1 Tax=Temnothorax americanus TaxID=1964332 RepID=UPI004068A41D
MLAHGRRNPNLKSGKNNASTSYNDKNAKAPFRPKYKYTLSVRLPATNTLTAVKGRRKKPKKHTEVESFFTKITQYSSPEPARDTDASQWCLDSGCTSHLCKDAQMLTNSIPTRSDIRLANNATSTVDAKGNVELLTSVNNKTKRIRLENTLHVPDLRINSLSVAKIVDKGYQVVFGSNQAFVKYIKGNIKLTAERQDHSTASTLFILISADQCE